MASYSFDLPQQLQQEAEQWAANQGVVLDQFILWAIAEKVAALKYQLDDPAFPAIGYRQGSSGQPVAVIRGTGIRVQTLAIAAHQWELSGEQVAEEYNLSLTQVQAALGFYDAHRAEIDGAIAAEQAIESASV